MEARGREGARARVGVSRGGWCGSGRAEGEREREARVEREVQVGL